MKIRMFMLLATVITCCYPYIAFASCSEGDQRCYVMTNDHSGSIYLVRDMVGSWTAPIKVFSSKDADFYVARGDLLMNIFNAGYLKTGNFEVNVLSDFKDEKARKNMGQNLKGMIEHQKASAMGGNEDYFRFMSIQTRFDMKNDETYSGGRWGALFLDRNGILITIVPLAMRANMTNENRKISAGIINALEKEADIARSKRQIN